jgi:LysR family transcriptional regulator, transcriptional activator for dmlA
LKTASPSELEFFVLLARHGSLSAAARALDITPPAATMRLAAIEERLGIRLVNRNTRRISLTSEGEIYLQHATRLLEELREMDEIIAGSRQTPRGLLRVNAPLGFGRTVIAPMVSAFTTRYPDVEIQLDVTDRPIDLIDQGFDLAIRFGELPDSRLNTHRVMSNRRFLCASPLYLESHGTPKALEDLASHRCILHRQNDDAYGVWHFTQDGRTEIVKVHGALSSNDGNIVTDWALDGQGIVIRSEWDAAKYFESGRLTCVLPEFTLPSADLYVYYPSKKNLAARARAFINFLVDQLAA